MKTIKNILSNFNRYTFLMKQLILRDFKVKLQKKYFRNSLELTLSCSYDVSNGYGVFTNV